MDDADQIGVEPELRHRPVAHELADHDHPVRAAHRPRPGDGSEGALCAREHLRQVEVLHVEQRGDGRAGDGREAQGEWVMHDVGPFETCAQAARPDGCLGHREQAPGDRPSRPVLRRDLRREARSELGSKRRQEHPVGVLTVAGEVAQQLAHVGLAATQLPRNEREERDPDRHRPLIRQPVPELEQRLLGVARHVRELTADRIHRRGKLEGELAAR